MLFFFFFFLFSKIERVQASLREEEKIVLGGACKKAGQAGQAAWSEFDSHTKGRRGLTPAKLSSDLQTLAVSCVPLKL